jgi:hypothetical protein
MALPNPTPLGATERYMVAGTRKISWVPTIASKASPTLTELNAGTDLSSEYQAVSGFNVTGNDIEVPDAGSDYTSKIPGRTTTDDSSITFYADLGADDVRSLLTRSLAGFVVIYPEGIVSGGKMDVWPVRVKSVSKQQDIEAAGMIEVAFSVTSKPSENIAIPSA